VVERGELGRGWEKLRSVKEDFVVAASLCRGVRPTIQIMVTTARRQSAVATSIGARIPFLFVAIVLGAASIFAAVVRLTDRIAINPWEPAIAMEAVRLNAGLPVYDSAHATHMYGPLVTIMFAGMFRVTGLNLLAARIVMSIFALTLAIFLAFFFRRNASRGWIAFAALLFLGINFRTNLALLSIQPDCIAILIASVALLIWIKHRSSLIGGAGAILLLVCAMFFKQTAAAFALIPIAFVLMWRRPLTLRELLISAIPTMSILAALALVRLTAPEMFRAIVTVPASIQVHWERAPGIFLYLIATFPLFFIALIAAFSKQRPFDERERWIFSALVLLVSISVWAICKSGGSYNSLLPAYFAMTALFVLRLDVIIEWLSKLTTRRAVLASSIIALIILLSFFVQFDRALAVLTLRHGDEKYDLAVKTAHELGNGVISPQDPTIAYRATGYLGNSLIFELDTHAVNGNWPSNLPESLSRELAAAKFVVQVKSFVPNPMFDRALEEHGFSPVPVVALADSAYTIWGKQSN
jgi:hypothetical protein